MEKKKMKNVKKKSKIRTVQKIQKKIENFNIFKKNEKLKKNEKRSDSCQDEHRNIATCTLQFQPLNTSSAELIATAPATAAERTAAAPMGWARRWTE